MEKDVKVIGEIRAGSQIAYWKPHGLLEAVIEVHPEHPPRLHYMDGRPALDLEPSSEHPAMVEAKALWISKP